MINARLVILVFILCFIFPLSVSSSTELYFIDAHSQVSHEIELAELLERMRAAGISKTIISSRRERPAFDVADWAESHPDKIIPSVRIKSKQYIKNTRKFYKKLHKQVDSGRFRAMSELLLFHAQKGELAGEVIVYPDDERVTAALQAAKSQGWPLVIHIEFASLHGTMRETFWRKMQELITANPKQAFCLTHMGQLEASEVAELIQTHENIYFMTSHANPIAVQRSNQPWINMFDGNELAPDWKTLIINHPQRFIFAIDNVWAVHWRNDYKPQVTLWREALMKLPNDVAHSLAHGNAERLWGL